MKDILLSFNKDFGALEKLTENKYNNPECVRISSRRI